MFTIRLMVIGYELPVGLAELRDVQVCQVFWMGPTIECSSVGVDEFHLICY